MSLKKRLKDAWQAFTGTEKSAGTLYFGMNVKRCWECEYKSKPSIRDNLLVTAGARAAYMDDAGVIDIPDALKGEDELARYIACIVDEYLAGDLGNFDIQLELALKEAYGRKGEENES